MYAGPGDRMLRALRVNRANYIFWEKALHGQPRFSSGLAEAQSQFWIASQSCITLKEI
jgi:hypothetical protein